MNQLQLFAWEASEKGSDVHMHANPTQADLLYREFQKKKEKLEGTVKESIVEKYGGAEHLAAPPKELLLAQTENYVEYSPAGRVIKGQERAKAKSKYEEDGGVWISDKGAFAFSTANLRSPSSTVYTNNHKSVWGSFWRDGQWGYACCHSTTRNSYCTGEAGKAAAKAATISSTSTSAAAPRKTLVEAHLDGLKSGKKEEKKDQGLSKKRKGEGDVQLDSKKLKAYMEEEKARKKAGVADLEGKYNSMKGGADVTEEELEAFRLQRRDADDPMNAFLEDD